MAEAAVQAPAADPIVTVRFIKRVRQYNPGERAGFPRSIATRWVIKGLATIMEDAVAEAETPAPPKEEEEVPDNPPLPDKEPGDLPTGTRTKRSR